MERRKFTREFKLEAVRLIKERGVSYMPAAQDLGVHPTQLRNWVKALADDPQHAFPVARPAARRHVVRSASDRAVDAATGSQSTSATASPAARSG
jgi:transposase-like protein